MQMKYVGFLFFQTIYLYWFFKKISFAKKYKKNLVLEILLTVAFISRLKGQIKFRKYIVPKLSMKRCSRTVSNKVRGTQSDGRCRGEEEQVTTWGWYAEYLRGEYYELWLEKIGWCACISSENHAKLLYSEHHEHLLKVFKLTDRYLTEVVLQCGWFGCCVEGEW